MATIINNDRNPRDVDSGSGWGAVVVILIILIIIGAIIWFRRGATTPAPATGGSTSVQVNLPGGTGGGSGGGTGGGTNGGTGSTGNGSSQ